MQMQDLVSDIYMCIILMKQAEGVKSRLFNTGHALFFVTGGKTGIQENGGGGGGGGVKSRQEEKKKSRYKRQTMSSPFFLQTV